MTQPFVPHSQQRSSQGSAQVTSSTQGCRRDRWMNTSYSVDSFISYLWILPLLDSSSSNSSKARESLKLAFLMMNTRNSGFPSTRSIWMSSPKQAFTFSISSPCIYAFTVTLMRQPWPYFSLSILGLSRHTNCPLIRMPISEQRDSASFMECVVSTMAVFLDLAEAARHFQRNLREMGSTPAEGSSKKATCGLPTMAMPTHILRLLPPLSTPALTCRQGRSESRSAQKSMVGRMALAGRPLTRQKYSRCS